MYKCVISPSYKLVQFDNHESSDFIDALHIYSNNIPSELRTSTNEIITWFNDYNKEFSDKLMLFGLYEENKLIGFSQQIFFKKENFIVIDYMVIDEAYRGNHTFHMFIALLEKFYKEYKYEYDFIITEIDIKNNVLARLLRLNSFGEIQSKYFQPQLGLSNHDSQLESKLFYYRADEEKNIKLKTLEIIIHTIYYKHYIRWYTKFFTKDEINLYIQKIKSLEIKIFNELNTEIIKVIKDGKQLQKASLFTTKGKEEVKDTTTVLFVVIIFAACSLGLGKFFELNISQLLLFLVSNFAIFLIVYSLFSKKGLVQLKALLNFFDKIK